LSLPCFGDAYPWRHGKVVACGYPIVAPQATPAQGRKRGVLNDALVYFADATLASAFVARWCVGAKVGIAGGVFQMREDEPETRIGRDWIGHDERTAEVALKVDPEWFRRLMGDSEATAE